MSKNRLAVDMTGRVYGRITVVRRVASVRPAENKLAVWLCRCSCGNEKIINGRSLRSGATKSCGCLNAENITVHGHGRTGANRSKTYQSWYAMIQRCNNQSQANWDRYGGRGITICDRWYAFENFLADMGERPDGHTLDRIDNDGNYEPRNCQWATSKDQHFNRGVTKLIEANSIQMTMQGWSQTCGIPYSTLRHRINKMGLTPHEAIFGTTPKLEDCNYA